MRRRGSRSSWQRNGARLLRVASFLTLPALGVVGMDSRAEAAAAESPELCLSDALCRAHYKRARTLSGDGDFQAALEAYQTAYRRRAASWLLLSIGRTLHKLGRPSEALGYYNQYKEKEPHPAPELETRLNEYIKEVQEELAGTLTAAKPSPAPGSVQSKATAERSEEVVPPAAESDSTIAEPAPPALLNTPQPPLPAPMADASPVLPRIPLLPRLGEVTPARTQSDHESGAKPSIARSRSSGIAAGSVLGALGLVGIATGLGFYAQTLADRSQFSLTGDEFDKLALLQRSQGFQVASPIGFSIGAALLATGVGILGYSAYKARHRHADRPRIAFLTQDRRYMLGLTGVY